MKRLWNLISALALSAGSILLLGGIQDGAAAAWGNSSVLNNDDCMKCHAVVFSELQDGGGKHKSRVSCIDCHQGAHPPGSPKGALIPECVKCHKDTAHFTLANCTGCHRKPHQPLAIFFDGGQGQKPACNTCHPDQVAEVNSHQSSHTGFACSFCHKKHRDSPDCLKCHKVHAEGQILGDCYKCHQPHQPLTLMYGTDITNSDCGGCHSDVQKTLEASKAKHAKFQCITCHANRHAVIPSCEQCHANTHNRKMIQNFPSCNECHQSAHDIIK